jgi:hypothetical protein
MLHSWLSASPPRRRVWARGIGAPLLLSTLIVSALLSTLLAVSGCSTTVTSNNVQLVIAQHTANLTLASGQTAAQTVLCDTQAGEVLISGGYVAANVSLKSTTPTNDPNVIGEDHLILGNYPSDASGTAPSALGQVEPGWTVRATNPLASPITLAIFADCLKGGGVSTITTFNAASTSCVSLEGARGAPTAPSSACGKDWEIGCPVASRGLTGGGWSADNFITSSYPIENHGVNDQRWVVHAPPYVDATAYAVCAKNLYSLPLASAGAAAPPAGSSSCYPAGCGYLRTMQQTAACPTDGVLVGGGWDKMYPFAEASTSAMAPSLAIWAVRDSIVDTTGYFSSTFTPSMTVFGVCVTAKAPKYIFITFSNYHHLIRIPADQVIAATDGSGQIPAVQHTVRVSQVASGPLAAPAVTDPFTGGRYYQVPAGCGDPSPAVAAAKGALSSQLRGQTSADETVFSGPTYTINLGSLTCAPAAGTRQPSPFTYVQHIDGAASQTSFKPADVRAYQGHQVQAALTQVGPDYALLSSDICPDGLIVSNASPTRATISCPASGVARYDWTPAKETALAAQLAGKTPDEAKALLDANPGVQPGSAIIDGIQGAHLPSDPSQIQLIVVESQANG